MKLGRETLTSVVEHESCPVANIAVGNTATTSVNVSFLVTRSFLLISLFLFNKQIGLETNFL